jgi:hypothetical protein
MTQHLGPVCLNRISMQWMTEVELCGEDFSAGKIDEGEFRKRMQRLGFDPGEIDEHLEAVTCGHEHSKAEAN